jgi:hypothetical protein
VLEKKFYKIRLKGQKESKGRKRPVGSLQFKRSAFYLKDRLLMQKVLQEWIQEQEWLLMQEVLQE